MSFFSRNWKIKLWNPRMDTKGIWVESFSNSNIDIIAKFLYFFGSDYYFIESQLISCVESWISVNHSIQDFHCLMRFLKSILDLSVKFQFLVNDDAKTFQIRWRVELMCTTFKRSVMRDLSNNKHRLSVFSFSHIFHFLKHLKINIEGKFPMKIILFLIKDIIMPNVGNIPIKIILYFLILKQTTCFKFSI